MSYHRKRSAAGSVPLDCPTATHVGYGVDNPKDSQLGVIDPDVNVGQLSLNEVTWWNVIWEMKKHLSRWGLSYLTLMNQDCKLQIITKNKTYHHENLHRQHTQRIPQKTDCWYLHDGHGACTEQLTIL